MENILMRAQLTTLTVLGLASLAGCAHGEPPPVVPQQTLAAVVEAPAENAAENLPAHDVAPAPEPVKHHVEITVDHLPSPRSFDAAATTYVFWVRANEEDAWSNAAHLEPSKSAEEANFEFPQDTLLVHVTAESRPDASSPSQKVVLSARVSSNGACGHSVDQNDVKMRVRMCH
jgi:hypothetical protein